MRFLAKWLWFPESVWLVQHWWHRLATVVTYLWIGLLLSSIWLDGVSRNHFDCLHYSGDPQSCGDNSYQYLFNGPTSTLATFVIGSLVVVLVPSAIYRLILFIVTGNKWRDAPAA